MFFYRSRDPHNGYSPAAGCFGYLLATLVIAAILIVCAVYIGLYVLLGLLIIGSIVGGLTAVFALFKALPQTIRDMSSQTYRGSRMAVLLKKIGYFFVCIAKYSISNDLRYAKSAFQRFAASRTLSFSKWVNLALAVMVLVFGLLILVAILLFAVMGAIFLVMLAINAVLLSVALMLGIGLLYNVFLAAKEAIYAGKRSFYPVCFKFVQRCRFSDLLSVPKTFFKQMGAWIGITWKNAMNLSGKYKSWLTAKRGILYPLAIAFIISCPISTLIFMLLSSLVLVALALLIYLADAIWIIIRAVFKF